MKFTPRSPANNKKGSFWSDIESLGLSEVVMAEQVRAMRALANTTSSSGAKKPVDPGQELGRLLKHLVQDRA